MKYHKDQIIKFVEKYPTPKGPMIFIGKVLGTPKNPIWSDRPIKIRILKVDNNIYGYHESEECFPSIRAFEFIPMRENNLELI